MQFDFSREAIPCQSKHISLQPNDKVLYERVHRYTGARLRMKAIVSKLGTKKVSIRVRMRDRRSGEVSYVAKSVEIFRLYRYDWKED